MDGEMTKRTMLAAIEEVEVDIEGRMIVIEEPVIQSYEEPCTPCEEVCVVADEEVAYSEAPDLAAVAVDVVGEQPAPKYVNKSFAQKMVLADEVIQDRYDELKNYALRFKKLKGSMITQITLNLS